MNELLSLYLLRVKKLSLLLCCVIMATELGRVKEIDQYAQDLVFGYIRILSDELLLGIIPSLIMYKCVLYFYDSEYFEIAANGITISADKKMIIKRSNVSWKTTVYGKQWIDSNENDIIKWKFRIIEAVGTASGIAIGIVSTDDCLNEDFCYAKDRISYCYSSAPIKFSNGYNYSKHYAFSIQKGDVISIILDLGKTTIFYNKNNDNDDNLDKQNILFDNVIKSDDVRYKLAVCLRNVDDCVELIDFKIIRK